MERKPTTSLAHREVTEAIDLAGPVLFGMDWIDRLTDDDRKFLEHHGRRDGNAPAGIHEYPPAVADRLARLLSQDFRMGVQRASVLHWLFANKVITERVLKCERQALDTALAAERAKQKSGKQDGTPGNKRGRSRAKIEGVIINMLADLRNRKTDDAKLKRATGDFLTKSYAASRNTCVKARDLALAEWDRQRSDAVSKIPDK